MHGIGRSHSKPSWPVWKLLLRKRAAPNLCDLGNGSRANLVLSLSQTVVFYVATNPSLWKIDLQPEQRVAMALICLHVCLDRGFQLLDHYAAVQICVPFESRNPALEARKEILFGKQRSVQRPDNFRSLMWNKGCCVKIPFVNQELSVSTGHWIKL